MSMNINQVFVANPATSLQTTDLFYLGRSPYGIGNDMACLFSTLLAAIPSATWVNVSGTSQAMTANVAYTANNAGLVTLTLPTTAAAGTTLEVTGLGAGGWSIAQNASQLIHLGSSVTTTGVGGSLSSTNRYDTVVLRCVVANTTWNVTSVIGNLTVV